MDNVVNTRMPNSILILHQQLNKSIAINRLVITIVILVQGIIALTQ